MNASNIIEQVGRVVGAKVLLLEAGGDDDVPAVMDPSQIRPDYFEAARQCVVRMREIGHAWPLKDYVKREVMPTNVSRAELNDFVRNGARTYWHFVGTAMMGTEEDSTAVVDGKLRTYGVERLRIADASVMPRITAGNTMAPCVVIGEQAASFVKEEHHP